MRWKRNGMRHSVQREKYTSRNTLHCLCSYRRLLSSVIKNFHICYKESRKDKKAVKKEISYVSILHGGRGFFHFMQKSWTMVGFNSCLCIVFILSRAKCKYFQKYCIQDLAFLQNHFSNSSDNIQNFLNLSDDVTNRWPSWRHYSLIL